MKKLLLLFLLVAGGVSTASAVVFYVQDNCGWGNIYVHAYGGRESTPTSWPGNKLTITTVIDGITFYKVDTGDHTNFIINNGVDGTKEGLYNERSVKTPGDVTADAYYHFTYSNTGADGDNKIKWYNLGQDGTTTYTYNFTVTTASSWGDFRICLWNTSTSTGISGFEYPGKVVTGTDDVYSYTHKSFLSTLGVLFADNSNATTLKTGDLTASSGTNNYYISTITKDGGQGIKTNSSGYATAVSSGNLDMTSGIAYVAEDMGSWAKAHTITGINYNNPFLVAGSASTTYHFAYGSGGTLPCTNAFHAGSGSGLASTTDDKYNYILNGGAFYAAAGQTVGTNKAYLQISEAVPAGARVIVFDDNETTGIKNLTPALNEGAVYDLQGRKVMNPAKGLYIVNGKKVIK